MTTSEKPTPKTSTTASVSIGVPCSVSPAREVHVSIERSVGTASGFDQELPALRRFLQYQTARWLEQRQLYGKWSLVVFVSREAVDDKPACELCGKPKGGDQE